MKDSILEAVKHLKKQFEPEGFIILGVFGSYARGEETSQSDIDLLYELSDTFQQKYSGWDFFARIELIKLEMQKVMGYKIDLANKAALDKIARYFILPEVIYVA